MQIVINHLTRMQAGYFCAAGINLETLRHIRPVKVGMRLRTEMLARYGGPFELGNVIDIGPAKPVGQRPEVEDHELDWSKVKVVDKFTGAQFWEIMQKVSRPKLRQVFGPALKMMGMRSCAIEPGCGLASLGCVVFTGIARLFLKSRPPKPDQVRIAFTDGVLRVDVGLTDIRLYGRDHVTPDQTTIDRVAKRLRAAEPVILSVGVGRAPPPSEDGPPPVHWLQVNNIHFNDETIWRLG
jgi:hypothetical protein